MRGRVKGKGANGGKTKEINKPTVTETIYGCLGVMVVKYVTLEQGLTLSCLIYDVVISRDWLNEVELKALVANVVCSQQLTAHIDSIMGQKACGRLGHNNRI
jgi:hypothetical protein